MEQKEKSKFAQWLELLQQESWQLELIISGFAIFLLAGLYQPLQGIWRQVLTLASSSEQMRALIIPVIILQGSWLVLLINLVIHVLLRGLWISTVGLRYVSEDIDFEQLRLRPRFDRFLRRHIGSFDQYIERLEKVCSIIFAFTFLLVFILIALGLWLTLFGAVEYFFEQLTFGFWVIDLFEVVIKVTLVLTSLVYFIDFLTLGWVKRIKWLTGIYYPVYRFYGWVTLSFLYRPMYYNLADNRFGRWVGFLLAPYIIGIMIVSSITFVTETYFPKSPGELALNTTAYDDQRGERDFYGRASIPSKYLSNGFLELFLVYRPGVDDSSIKSLCPDLAVGQLTGIRLEGVIQINGGNGQDRTVNKDSLLLCMSQIHQIYIDDSLHTDLNYRFYRHPELEKPGLFTMLDVAYLPRGEHVLRIETCQSCRDTTSAKRQTDIPFWKE